MNWFNIYYITSFILYIYSGYVTASEYYVSAAPNGVPCSNTHLPCHNLSYYTDDYTSYFTDDTIFYFLEGTHILQGTLEISGVSNITLQGLGHIEQGFHETVMQSTSVIMCSDYNRSGIQFISSTNIVLESLTIANCGFIWNMYYIKFSLFFIDINNIALKWVSVQNGSGIGLYLYNAFDVLIANSTFANNGGLMNDLGTAVIFYNGQVKRLSRVNIVKSNFTLGLGSGMNFLYFSDNKVEVIIEKSKFSQNTAQYGGGIIITSYARSGSIEFSNCTIYDNTAQNGGGIAITSYARSGSIEFSNCTIYNNIAQKVGGGVDIFLLDGSGSIEFSNCTIYNNTAQKIGGGVDISLINGNGSIEFSNCTIYDNTAQNGGGIAITSYAGSGSIEFSNCTIYNNIAQKVGGGVDIFLLDGSGSIEFSNCTIYDNTAQMIGGGVEISLINGSGSIEFSNCTIYDNTAQDGGGTAITSYAGSGSIDFSNCTIYDNTVQKVGGGVYIFLHNGSGSIEFSNCTIYDNTAQNSGGGVSIYLFDGSGSIDFSNCTIYNNTAYYGSGLSALQDASTSRIHFTNVSFYFNKVSNKLHKYHSAVLLENIKNVTFDQIDISNHNTTGLLSIDSPIMFDGHNTFINNSGINGGGMALYGFSQLLLNQNMNISFADNHASESGGGIFVSQVIDGNDLTICSFKNFPYYNTNNKTMLYFVNNTAYVSGDVMYGGKISNCLNFDFDHQFHYPQQTGLSVVSSDPIQACFCESNRQNCSIRNITITAIPGINVNISLATVGNKDGLTKGVIKLTTSDSSSSNVQTDNTRLNATCTNVTFKLRANPSLNTTQVYVTSEGLISELSSNDIHYVKVTEVNIESCPIGFPLINNACSCRSELNTSSITCDINTQIITRDGDMWIGYQNDSDCLIVYPHCPFDYCNDGTVHFKITSPDPQCLLNRYGILCGQCAKGLSLMLGTNQCGQCTNNYIALIIPFALAGIALVAFIIALNLTVSVGTINGLIFYANVVKIYEPIFFPKGPIPFLNQFISWLNLDLGIETCFFDGMDSCSKTWLQFIFPGYVWFLIILIIILSRYSSKMVRLVGRQAIPVLATMILLSYTKLIRTVFQALYFINIQCNGNNNVPLLRWYIDANVQYVRGCHIPLFLFSLAVLILLIVPYTFYLLTIPLLEGPLSKYMRCCQKYMKPFFDAYGGPYKDKCRFWTGFLLLVRVALALVVSLDIGGTISLDVLTFMLIVIVILYIFLMRIYRHLPLFYLESSFILNLILMAHMNLQTSEKSKGQVSSIFLVSISFVVFCGIIFYHVWDRLLKSRSQQLMEIVKKIFKKFPPFSHFNDIEDPPSRPGSPVVVCNTTSVSVVSVDLRRESILFDKDDKN